MTSPSNSTTAIEATRKRSPTMNACLTVLEGGLSTSIQDLGRVGYQSLGIPVSGALDGDSLRLANALVGNDWGMGALEIRLLGPTIRVDCPSVRVALVGGDAPLQILEPAPRSIASGESATLEEGTVMKVAATGSSRLCLSCDRRRSSHQDTSLAANRLSLRARIGGLEGRALRSGDRLPVVSAVAPETPDMRIALDRDDNRCDRIRIVVRSTERLFCGFRIAHFLE